MNAFNSDVEQILPIDPFGSMPNWKSALGDFGGTEEPSDRGYVFRSVPVRPAIGHVNFTIVFHDLRATSGTLEVTITPVGAFPGFDPVPLEPTILPLATLAAENGVLELGLQSSHNTLYIITARIQDKFDAQCSAISIVADRRATAADHNLWGRHREVVETPERLDNVFVRSWLTKLDQPNFDLPGSQGWTRRQCQSPVFRQTAEALGLGHALSSEETWRHSYILRCLEVAGLLDANATGIAFVNELTPLIPAVVARGAKMLLAQHISTDALGSATTEVNVTGDAYDLTAALRPARFDWLKWPQALNGQFAFAFSMSADKVLGVKHLKPFILSTVESLLPGGIAVHVFDYLDTGAEQPHPGYLSRTDVEQIAAIALSHLNRVGVLRFRGVPSPYQRPFGLLIQRGW